MLQFIKNYQRVIHHFIKTGREAHLRGAPLRGVWQPRMGESRPCGEVRCHVETLKDGIMGNLWENMGNLWEIYGKTMTGWWFGTFGLMFPHIGNFIIPSDELIFFRRVGIPASSYVSFMYIMHIWLRMGWFWCISC